MSTEAKDLRLTDAMRSIQRREQRRLRVLGQRAHMDLGDLWREVI